LYLVYLSSYKIEEIKRWERETEEKERKRKRTIKIKIISYIVRYNKKRTILLKYIKI